MLRSMTAFSETEITKENLSVKIEIRSYNSKYLDVVTQIAREYGFLEDKIRNLTSEKISRGRIEITLQIKDDTDKSATFEINVPRAVSYYNALVELKNMFNITEPLSLELLLNYKEIIQPVEPAKNTESYWILTKECLSMALDNMNAMRKKEGEFIANDLAKRLKYIESCINQVESSAEWLLDYYKDKLKERINALTKGSVDIDPIRIAQEASLFAEKSDISEELTKAKSHINQFYTIMGITIPDPLNQKAFEPCGKKLNFLLQELLREFNTMSSKVYDANISHIIIEVKCELEKIREQIQNIE